MPTANELLRDALIAHEIDLQHFSNGSVRRVIALLNRVDADLMAQLTAALERLPAGQFSVERLESLLTSVAQLNTAAYQRAGDDLAAQLLDLVVHEAEFHKALLESLLPVRVQVAAVSAQQTYAAALARPFQGRLLREWSKDIAADRMTRIRDAVRIGFVENQTTSQIVRRVRGTKAKGYSDGIIEIDRRNAEAVVRTAISHTAGSASDDFYERNGDLVKALRWTATLDSRTSEGCRIRDGKDYKPGTHAPIGHTIPWAGGPGRLHWNCRSCSTPILKSWKDMGIDMEEFTPTTRASLDGQVPAETTYGEWLKRQSAARQDEVLGATRGKLMRDGGLTLDRFYNDRGVYLSIDQLRERSAAAFKRAGV